MISKSNIEKILLFVIGLSFFIGTWHAFPMLNIVGDEMYYVGGVLRAMEAHTMVPFVGDVPYGTLTYLLNYFFSFIPLSILLIFFKFHVASLKLYLIGSPSIMYFSLRILSAILSLVYLYLINTLLKKELEDIRVRFFLLFLLFTNIITTLILHTGKMWVLSTLLVVISFYYLYKSLHEGEAREKKNILLSIVFSFLAFSNFPLNIYALINIPLLLFYFRGNKNLIYKIIQYVFLGFIIYLLITLFNFESIKEQIISVFTQYHKIEESSLAGLNFGRSLLSYCLKLIYLFPLFLLTLCIAFKDKIKSNKLFSISLIYFLTYFLLIVLVANWAEDTSSYMRYLFPLGFFLTFLISSFNLKFRGKIFYPIMFISVLFGSLTLYYLSVPTTYNLAFNWVEKNLSSKDVLIINKVGELQLTKNKESSLLSEDQFCATKCHNTIDFSLNTQFKPLVVDLLSKPFNETNYRGSIYYILDKKANDSTLLETAVFENNSPKFHTVDYNIGSYFDLSYFRLKNFGRNVYIYKKI
jgi:hypothetical protein